MAGTAACLLVTLLAVGAGPCLGATRRIDPVATGRSYAVYSLASLGERHVSRAVVRSGHWHRRVPLAAIRRARKRHGRVVVHVPARVLHPKHKKPKPKKPPKPTKPSTTTTSTGTTTAPTGPPLVVSVDPPATTAPPATDPPASNDPGSTPSTPADPTGTPTATLPAVADTLPGGLQGWRAPGTPPLSDAAAAALVHHSPELRPANADANHHAPTADEIRAYHEARYEVGGNKGLLNSQVITTLGDVSGNFVGTTDEILQWASYKWGIPLDIVRAVAQNESNWNMSQLGDRATVADSSPYPAYSRVSPTSVYQSLGIMQIKWKADGSRHPGTEPLRWESTAFNVDYWAANIRFFYDGAAKLWFGTGGPYQGGDGWLSVGAWYNPTPWNNPDQLLYISHVQQKVDRHAWTSTGF